ncbi:MAG: hypothetical protein ACJ765_07475 [Chloroflexota bacterium]
MHPIVTHELARGRIADFYAAAAADRRALAARRDPSDRAERGTTVRASARWGNGTDPTGLVRRLLGRLRPAVAP